MRVSPLIVVVFSIALAAPVTAQEALSLSRYRVNLETLENGNQTHGEILDQTAFEDRCRDVDGCEISLVIGGFSPSASLGRIIVFTDSDLWLGVQSTLLEENKDTNPDLLAQATDGFNSTCKLTDADDRHNTEDTTAAFVVWLGTTEVGATCVLTVTD